MKVCIIQPQYLVDYSLSDIFFEKEPELLNQCDDSMYSVIPPLFPTSFLRSKKS